MSRELITAYTKEVNGEKVPMWDGEEIDEIVTAQVFISCKVLPQVLSFFYLNQYSLIGCTVYEGWLRYS